ncbi:putative fasciclin-like arabinogalactan family protein [Senna tora]|uniref:Putative fasciclin-like arabinogalactan family protein n=1 Tax=Senna tora TaxID=362788 RepID=A0A834X913_9FABA|nr:putative fasciclin-like arabinogalactan family protein [Senna tora]
MALPHQSRLFFFFTLVFLLGFTRSQTLIHPFNHTDTELAIEDMRSKSYYGFAMLLRMLNGTSMPIQELTFLMPEDKELSASFIEADRIEEFLLSHAIPMALYFSDMSHFPTGSILPSGISNKMMRIHNINLIDKTWHLISHGREKPRIV